MTTTPDAVTLSIEASDLDTATALTDALQDFEAPPPLAISMFEQRDPTSGKTTGWRIDAYFDTAPSPNDLRACTTHIPNAANLDLQLTPTPDENWVAISQAALPPVHARRFTIHGSHDRARIAAGPNTIEIEAGEAFGTAHHATTYLCLNAIDSLSRSTNAKHALDLGCGTGILAIALARANPHCKIIATDIDPRAVEVTQENARHNRVAQRITCIVANGLSHPSLARPNQFDLILANILAAPLIAVAKNLASIAMPRAAVVLSGLLTDQAPAVIATYRAAGFNLLTHNRQDEWSALILQKK